jgi:hypothetical protein
MGPQTTEAGTAGFGKRRLNRRKSSRELIALEAILSTLSASQTAMLEDVSSIGARFGVANSPDAGKDMLVRIGPVVMLAKIDWRDRNGCGVLFDEPISDQELRQLRVKHLSSSLASLSEEELLAARRSIGGPVR